MEALLLAGGIFVPLLVLDMLAYFYGYDSRESRYGVEWDEARRTRAQFQQTVWQWRKTGVQWQPFWLDVVGRHRREELQREATQERLLREATATRDVEGPEEGDHGLREVFVGVRYRTLASSLKLMVTEMLYQEHAQTTLHHHSSEQVGYVLAGRLRLRVDGQERVIGVGKSYLVPANTPHLLEALESARVIDVFSPPREDFLEPSRRLQEVAV